jgi:hypothetical protein
MNWRNYLTAQETQWLFDMDAAKRDNTRDRRRIVDRCKKRALRAKGK